MNSFKEKYAADIEFLLSKKHHLNGDYWTTPDHRIGKGSPFSSRDMAIMFSEFGFGKEDSEIKGLANTIFRTWQPDGRFKISPTGSIFPCHTITALRVLCYMGFSNDDRIIITFTHLLEIQHDDGGWRCNRVKLGKSDVSDMSNPGVTLEALDAFRFTEYLNTDDRLNQGVEFLLQHWEIKRPLGPCNFGIGTLFMQTEFPFLRYNLFYYCYVLSFYDQARKDQRFKEALSALDKKVVDGKMIVENPNRQLAKLDFCKRGMPSELATHRYNEIKKRMSNN
ncbi:hypothetical protein [Ekhidna sp.]|jgi:hypothetical protein|uniref:hypothetical protein n=1 Tax=Ekhidna sp. TaxID=2608089 RepID=UPI0032EF383E